MLSTLKVSFGGIKTTPIKKAQTIKLNKIPKTDSVSFKGLEHNNRDLQIYRCISEAELNNLLKGDEFLAMYTTSDPRGWQATSWQGGYRSPQSKGEVYFITFKKNKISILDNNDDRTNTRYIALRYTIDDVENVRKGTNAHGEIIYAPNLKEAKEKDKKEKQERISQLEYYVKELKNLYGKTSTWDELASYVKEFPQIVTDLAEYVNYKNADDLAGFLNLITLADKKAHLAYFNKTIEAMVEQKEYVPSEAYQYCQNHGNMNEFYTKINRRR